MSACWLHYIPVCVVFFRHHWAAELRVGWGASAGISETSSASHSETSPTQPPASEQRPDNGLHTIHCRPKLCDWTVFQTCDWSDWPAGGTDGDPLQLRTSVNRKESTVCTECQSGHCIRFLTCTWMLQWCVFSFTVFIQTESRYILLCFSSIWI